MRIVAEVAHFKFKPMIFIFQVAHIWMALISGRPLLCFCIHETVMKLRKESPLLSVFPSHLSLQLSHVYQSFSNTHTHTLPLTFCHIRVFHLRQSTALLTRRRCKTHHPNSLQLSGGFLSTRQHWECCYKYYDLSKLFYAQRRMSAKL